VIVNAAGTRSGPSTRVISASSRLAPEQLRPSLDPSAKSYTHRVSVMAVTRGDVVLRMDKLGGVGVDGRDAEVLSGGHAVVAVADRVPVADPVRRAVSGGGPGPTAGG
jgi:hypothetical protein